MARANLSSRQAGGRSDLMATPSSSHKSWNQCRIIDNHSQPGTSDNSPGSDVGIPDFER